MCVHSSYRTTPVLPSFPTYPHLPHPSPPPFFLPPLLFPSPPLTPSPLPPSLSSLLPPLSFPLLSSSSPPPPLLPLLPSSPRGHSTGGVPPPRPHGDAPTPEGVPGVRRKATSHRCPLHLPGHPEERVLWAARTKRYHPTHQYISTARPWPPNTLVHQHS